MAWRSSQRIRQAPALAAAAAAPAGEPAEEPIAAGGPNDAARIVADIINGRESLHRLDDTEPVQIKRPNRMPWGRNLTIADFRAATPPTADDEGPDGEGPVRPPSI